MSGRDISRRAFVAGSASVVGTTAMLGAAGASSQAPAAVMSPPAVDFSNQSIAQITMVVKDVEKVSRNFSHMFGSSWRYYEFRPQNLKVAGSAAGPTVIKLAIGQCGGHSFKLVQPVSGVNAYSEFLEKNGGEGFYGLGLGAPRNYEPAIAAIQKAGVGIAMQGDIGDGSQFTIFDCASDLGCRIEIFSAPRTATPSNLKEIGSHTASGDPIFDMSQPVLSGGRQFTQIGLVVKDAEKTGARWQALLGVRDWRFMPIPVSAAALEGRIYPASDLPSATVTQGSAFLGGTNIELLAPVAQGPGGVHRRFLDKHGDYNGFQHLMISPSAGPREPTLARLEKEGYKPEWTATVQLGKFVGKGDYIGMEEKLGGFLLEYNG